MRDKNKDMVNPGNPESIYSFNSNVSVITERGNEESYGMASNQADTLASAIDPASADRDFEYCFLQEIFESSPDCILLLENGSIRRANAAAGEFFGIDTDELRTKTLFDLSPEYQPDNELSGQKMELYRTQLERGPVRFRWVFTAAGALERTAIVTLTPIRVGSITRVMVHARDVTPLLIAHQKIESQYRLLQMTNAVISAMHSEESTREALKIVADELDSLFGNIVTAVYLISPDARVAECAILRENIPDFEELRGYSTIPVHKEPYAEVFQRGNPLFEEIRDLETPGMTGFDALAKRHSPTAVAIIPLVSDDRVFGSVNLFSKGREGFDPDERDLLVSIGREIGGAIQAGMMRDELKQTNDIANLFLDILVHDVNNAHNTIGGALELLTGAGEDERETYTNLIQSALDTAGEIHRNVMTIRSIRRGGDENLKPVAIDPVIQRAAPRGADIRFAQSGAFVYADELLSGIFLNLFGNALKYGGPDVEIQVTVTQDDSNVFVTIADTGPGILDQDKEQLFSRHLRIGSEKKGLGIGLYICWTLAERYGGTIQVADRIPGYPEKGSAFILKLRRAEP